MTAFEKALDFFRAPNNRLFLIATHVTPEGDALGSSIALAYALRQLGKSAIVYDRDGVPDYCKFLPGAGEVKKTLPPDYSEAVLVLVDCGHPERAGLEGKSFHKTVVIDHHETDLFYGDVNWTEPDASAAGILVFRLIKALGVAITKEIAVNLYTAIMTDTGSFRYQNTTPEALGMASELVQAGAEPAAIADQIYNSWTVARFRLLCMALGTFEMKDGAAMMHISKGMFHNTGTGIEDAENFTAYPRMLKDVEVSALLLELEDSIKVSLRSKGDTDVRQIAARLGGGGHKRAAGCKLKMSLDEAREVILKEILATR